jgi:multiple sugar transport system substrate-binding protein
MNVQKHYFLRNLARQARGGRISRRALMERAVALGLSGGALMALLEACGTGAASTNLTYLNLFGGGDGVRMIQMQTDFSNAHPEIDLEAITLAWGEPYYTKLAMAAAGGRPPDVAISHMTRMPPLAQGGLLDPIDFSELARYGVNQSDFLSPMLQRTLYNGQSYAVPLDTHPFVMFYNTNICKAADLLDANGFLKPIQGPDALISALKAAQQASNGGWGLALSIANADVTTWRLFYTLYSQLGGTVLTTDNQHLALDHAKAAQAVSFMTDLTQISKVASPTADYGGANALFASGKAGFYFEGEWEVTTFLTAKTPFNMAPFPNVFGGGQSQADSHTFVLPHQAVVDPARRAASYEFISFLLKDSLVWAHGGHIPAYQPIATSSAYQQLKPQSNYAQVATNVVIDPPAWFSGSGSEFETVMSSALQASLEGQLSTSQAVQQFSAGTQQLLDIPSPI